MGIDLLLANIKILRTNVYKLLDTKLKHGDVNGVGEGNGWFFSNFIFLSFLSSITPSLSFTEINECFITTNILNVLCRRKKTIVNLMFFNWNLFWIEMKIKSFQKILPFIYVILKRVYVCMLVLGFGGFFRFFFYLQFKVILNLPHFVDYGRVSRHWNMKECPQYL